MTASTYPRGALLGALVGLASCLSPPVLPREPVAYTKTSAPSFGPLARCTPAFEASAVRVSSATPELATTTKPREAGDTTGAPKATEEPRAHQPDRLRAHCYTRTRGSAAMCMGASDPVLLLALGVSGGAPICAAGPFQPDEPAVNDACCYRLGYAAE